MNSFNAAPIDWLGPGYSTRPGTVSFTNGPGGLLAGLTDDEASPSSGDIRKLVYELLEAFFISWRGKAAEKLPRQLTVNRSTSYNDLTQEIVKTYVVTVSLRAEELDVADEPSHVSHAPEHHATDFDHFETHGHGIGHHDEEISYAEGATSADDDTGSVGYGQL